MHELLEVEKNNPGSWIVSHELQYGFQVSTEI
jgi:hypothetical protein